jgi:hypothetical protein
VPIHVHGEFLSRIIDVIVEACLCDGPDAVCIGRYADEEPLANTRALSGRNCVIERD